MAEPAELGTCDSCGRIGVLVRRCRLQNNQDGRVCIDSWHCDPIQDGALSGPLAAEQQGPKVIRRG